MLMVVYCGAPEFHLFLLLSVGCVRYSTAACDFIEGGARWVERLTVHLCTCVVPVSCSFPSVDP